MMTNPLQSSTCHVGAGTGTRAVGAPDHSKPNAATGPDSSSHLEAFDETPPPLSQQDYLRAAKAELNVRWNDLATLAGIAPRALKTYRLPDASADHRGMPKLARRSIDQLLADRRRKQGRKRKS